MKRNTLIIITIAFIACAIVVAGIGRHRILEVSAPFRGQVSSIGGEVYKFLAWTGDVQKLVEDKERLATERNELLAKVAELKALERQNAQLRKQLGVAGDPEAKLLMANARGLIDRAGAKHLLLDKGAMDGIHSGMTVVSGGVMVGIVEDVEDSISYVAMPITAGEVIPAVIRIEGETTRGVAKAGFNLTAQLEQVLPSEKLEVGSTVLTSGEGGRYPADLVIGKVGQIASRQNDVFQQAIIELPWNPLDLETVFVMQK